jgi:ribosome-associated toxin RatA of RatAB toxin-antitoxin module
MFSRRKASISLDAPPEVVFAVVTDYNSYQEWMPQVHHSRILAADHELGVVHAEFIWPVYLGQEKFSVEFIHEPPWSVVYQQTDQFRQRGLSGRWHLAPAGDGDGTRLSAEMRLGTTLFQSFASRRKLRAMLDSSLEAVRARVSLVASGGLSGAQEGKLKILEVTRQADSLRLWLFGEAYEFKKIEGTG